jgi:RNA polymerase-binding transcription factor DksA
MDVSTQTHLARLREMLLYRQHELDTEIRAAELARKEPAPASEHEVTDQKDEAVQRQSQELGEAQEQRDIDELALVQAALRRLDAGTYGDCADCGNAIPLQRLLVQPAALRCAACQARREQHRLRA